LQSRLEGLPKTEQEGARAAIQTQRKKLASTKRLLQMAGDAPSLEQTVGMAERASIEQAKVLGIDLAPPSLQKAQALPSKAVEALLAHHKVVPATDQKRKIMTLDRLPAPAGPALAEVVLAFSGFESAAEAAGKSALPQASATEVQAAKALIEKLTGDKDLLDRLAKDPQKANEKLSEKLSPAAIEKLSPADRALIDKFNDKGAADEKQKKAADLMAPVLSARLTLLEASRNLATAFKATPTDAIQKALHKDYEAVFDLKPNALTDGPGAPGQDNVPNGAGLPSSGSVPPAPSSPETPPPPAAHDAPTLPGVAPAPLPDVARPPGGQATGSNKESIPMRLAEGTGCAPPVVDIAPLLALELLRQNNDGTAGCIYQSDYRLAVDIGGNDLYQNNAGGSGLLNTPAGDLYGLAGALIDLSGKDRYMSSATCELDKDGRPKNCRGKGVNGGAVGSVLGLTGNILRPAVDRGFAAGFLFDDGKDDPATGQDEGADIYAAGDNGTNGGAAEVGAVGGFGLGFLFDAGGGDKYGAGDNGANGGAQAVGGLAATYGTGLLIDGGGDDAYSSGDGGTNGGARASGSLATAKATGFLMDTGGNDAYTAVSNGTNGGAQSFGSLGLGASTGLLMDTGGNDAYTAVSNGTNGGTQAGGNLGLGQSTGLLIDASGNDTYTAQKQGVNGGASGVAGAASAPVGAGVGLLFDGGGHDLYSDTNRVACVDGAPSADDCSGGGSDITAIPKGAAGSQLDFPAAAREIDLSPAPQLVLLKGTVTVFLDPTSIQAGGSPRATSGVTATVLDAKTGLPLPGVRVDFYTSGDVTFDPPKKTTGPDGIVKVKIVASSTPGDETITATTSQRDSGSAVLTEYGPASQVALTLSPSSISADGTSRSSAVAKVTDAGGRMVWNESVRFSTSGDVAIAPSGNDGHGTHTTAITASDTPGFETITGTAARSGISTSVTLTETLSPWIQRSPATSPSDRFGSALTYDSDREKVVLFGGYVRSGPLGGTWTWDGKNWQDMSPATSPSNRGYVKLAYDPIHHETVLFGGYGGGNLGDTWTWNGFNWTKKSPPNSPSRRSSYGMVYDAAREQVVLFGGYDETSPSADRNDTWTWDGSNWTEVTPATQPPARYYPAMTYDPTSKEVVLFGGYHQGVSLGDTWTWNGTNWTEKAPEPRPIARYAPAMAARSGSGGAVMFGGSPDAYLEQLDETWAWNAGGWTRQSPASSPPPRHESDLAYDSGRQETVLFGGRFDYSGTLSDTWVYKEGPFAAAQPGSLSFGNQNAGTRSPVQEVKISNLGTAALKITDVDLTGSDPDEYAPIESNNCMKELAPGDSCSIGVKFSPTSVGAKKASLSIVYNGSNSPLTVPLSGTGTDFTEAKAATTTTVVSSVNPSNYGGPVTFTGRVTIAPGKAGTPTGNVTFKDGATILNSFGSPSDADGKASFTTSDLGAGSHSITARYNGNTEFDPSTSQPLTQVVNASTSGAATSTRVSSSLNPSVYGRPVSLTAEVTTKDTGSGVSPGKVVFKDGATELNSGGTNLSPNGKGVFTTSSLSVGPHKITAVYSGGSGFSSSTSEPLDQVVNPDRGTHMQLQLSPSSLPADGKSQTIATSKMTDDKDIPITDENVSFETDGDVVFTGVENKGDGTYTATITASSTPGIETITARAAVSGALAKTTLDERPTVSVSSVVVQEPLVGSTDAIFSVNLSSASPSEAKVDFATADDTAHAGQNYTAQSGQLTFGVGETQKSVTVPVLSDGSSIADSGPQYKTFFLRLSNPQGAILKQREGVGTIVDAYAGLPKPASLLNQQPRTQAGGIFLSGHDMDAHATLKTHDSSGGPPPDQNPLGAQRLIQRSIAYATKNESAPRLLLVTDLRNPGPQYTDSRDGMQAAGFHPCAGAQPTAPGCFEVADYGSGAPTLDIHNVAFSQYDAIVIASSYGGWLRQEELDVLNGPRKEDLRRYVNAGGGLVAFAEGERCSPSCNSGWQGNFGFLGCQETAPQPLGEQENDHVTATGHAMGITDADVKLNASHNIFLRADGFQIVDLDQDNHVISLATPNGLDENSCARKSADEPFLPDLFPEFPALPGLSGLPGFPGLPHLNVGPGLPGQGSGGPPPSTPIQPPIQSSQAQASFHQQLPTPGQVPGGQTAQGQQTQFAQSQPQASQAQSQSQSQQAVKAVEKQSQLEATLQAAPAMQREKERKAEKAYINSQGQAQRFQAKVGHGLIPMPLGAMGGLGALLMFVIGLARPRKQQTPKTERLPGGIRASRPQTPKPAHRRRR